MRTESDFIDTIVRLIRLTHQEKLVWVKEESGNTLLAPTYTAEINGLRFSLEDARDHPAFSEVQNHKDVSLLDAALSGATFGDVLFGSLRAPVYRLVITDLWKDEVIVSPPLLAADDLVVIIRGYDLEKLEEINRRLDAELG